MTDQTPAFQISGDALADINALLREWSGWPDARLVFGVPPQASPFAATNFDTHVVVANPDYLILNPNRALTSINPFRLKQEAVLTGALLHEAAHARWSSWMFPDEAPKHSDGSDVSEGAYSLAALVEEARIEGLMYAAADHVGAKGLGWTMRAASARLVPPTALSVDPEVQVLDFIKSWVLRAGRSIAITAGAHPTLPRWVESFNSILYQKIIDHLTNLTQPVDDQGATAMWVVRSLKGMCRSADHSGQSNLDTARDVLKILFPETEEPPSAGGGCGAGEQGDDESDEQSSEEGESPDEGDEPGDGSGGSESSTSDGEGGDEGLGNLLSEAQQQQAAEQTLASMEALVDKVAEEETEKEKTSGGAGSGGLPSLGGWRRPTPEEREGAKRAERFLRDLIEPNETSTRALVDSPSAVVDGPALSAWRASGGVRDPKFFIRTRRDVQPQPPVKIAILVDVSGSMEVLQEPSALLSWALASSALDLRNFAGRGAQIESTLIHWGEYARVIQKNGEALPGIRAVQCREGTDAMQDALELVDQELPGFFTVSEKPENRLLVQFTDWGLSGGRRPDLIGPALEAGVNMLTVAPKNNISWRQYQRVMRESPIQRGRSVVTEYDEAMPTNVWEEVARLLR